MARSNPHRRRPSQHKGPANRQPTAPKGPGSRPRTSRNGADEASAGRQQEAQPTPTEPELTADPQEPEVPSAREHEESRSESGTPADPRVTALLSEISELRLSAATHLTVAAAAMDAGRPDIAAELIEAQQRDVVRLRSRAAELLEVEGETAEQARRTVAHAAALEESALLATARTPTTKSLRRTPRSSSVAVLPRRSEVSRASHWSATGALLAVAVALLVAVMRPLAPHPQPPSPDEISASVVASLDANISRSYDQLRETAQPKTPQTDVEQATARLHADLQRLLPMAASDPVAARRVVAVLQAERKLLTEQAPDALAVYLPEAARIVTQLRSLADPAVLAILPPVEAVVPQPAVASDVLPSEPKPAPAPAAPSGTSDGGTSESHQTGSTGSAGSAGPADPAPVVQLPEIPQQPPAAPSTNDGGSRTGGTDSGSTNSGARPTGDGSGSNPLQLPLPQLPAPPVLDPAAN